MGFIIVRYEPINHFDDLKGSIRFHFYSQMVGMIRDDICAIKHVVSKCLNGIEMIF